MSSIVEQIDDRARRRVERMQALEKLRLNDPELNGINLDATVEDFLPVHESGILRSPQSQFAEYFADVVSLLRNNVHIKIAITSKQMLQQLDGESRELLFLRISSLVNLTHFEIPKTSVHDFQMSSSMLIPILLKASKLQSFHVRSLFFENEEEIRNFAAALNKRKESLETLCLCGLDLRRGSGSFLDAILDVVSSWPRLTKFTFESMRKKDLVISKKSLRPVLRSSVLKFLGLYGLIDDELCSMIAQELSANNTTLECLDLGRRNSIGKTGAAELLHLLENSNTLAKISLKNSEVGTDLQENIKMVVKLNGAGRHLLLNEKTTRGKCVEILWNVTDDLSALYYALRLKPDLCVLRPEEHKEVLLRHRQRVLAEKRSKIVRRQQMLAQELAAIDEEQAEIERERRNLGRIMGSFQALGNEKRAFEESDDELKDTPPPKKPRTCTKEESPTRPGIGE